jgi:hypothetical protein
MTDFRIIEEATIHFTNKDELYLMIIQEKEHYFIEVDSKTSRIGKRHLNSRKEAEVVFDQMQKRMNNYFDVWSVTEMLELAFCLETIQEHMFLVNNLNRAVPFNDIWKFKRQYSCQTTPVITDLVLEDDQYNRSIYITFPGKKEPLGYFRALDNESDFRFYLGDCYRFQI